MLHDPLCKNKTLIELFDVQKHQKGKTIIPVTA